MRRTLLIIFVAIMIFVLNSNSTRAAVVKVIESPFVPGLDLEWVGVAAGMGHVVTLDPVTDLDSPTWFATTDILIITDPYHPYTTLNYSVVLEAMFAGICIYIQAEEDPGFPGNLMFEFVVNASGIGSFTWLGPIAGFMEAGVTGPVAVQPNARPPVLDMTDACVGGGGGPPTGLFTNLTIGAAEVGFIYDEIVSPTTSLVATNSDYSWILPLGPDIALMENYIDVLDTCIELDHFFPITSTGVGSVPSGGGIVPYFVTLDNIGANFIPTTVWVRVFLPSGALYPPPVAGPGLVTVFPFTSMGPYASPGFLPTLLIPPFAPSGRYFVQSIMTSGYPAFTVAYDSDFFTFEKFVVSADATGEEVPVDQLVLADLSAGLNFAASLDVEETLQLPVNQSVSEAYPNPFNPSTNISIQLAEQAGLTVRVYDLQGREVAELANGQFTAGQHTFSFNAQGLASGVYFLRANVPGKLSQTRKLVLMQ
jgi:Secretion system C-terminal sorting domain